MVDDEDGGGGPPDVVDPPVTQNQFVAEEVDARRREAGKAGGEALEGPLDRFVEHRPVRESGERCCAIEVQTGQRQDERVGDQEIGPEGERRQCDAATRLTVHVQYLGTLEQSGEPRIEQHEARANGGAGRAGVSADRVQPIVQFAAEVDRRRTRRCGGGRVISTISTCAEALDEGPQRHTVTRRHRGFAWACAGEFRFSRLDRADDRVDPVRIRIRIAAAVGRDRSDVAEQCLPDEVVDTAEDLDDTSSVGREDVPQLVVVEPQRGK